jgi:hypothetical protein
MDFLYSKLFFSYYRNHLCVSISSEAGIDRTAGCAMLSFHNGSIDAQSKWEGSFSSSHLYSTTKNSAVKNNISSAIHK